ncbi:MAG: hypoxanthine phosphoribosyltransferase [Bdellovibrionales bacterium]|nr:hypoxanthine phosphoribosyltransferase [Bdellovibrionales bacterium]
MENMNLSKLITEKEIQKRIKEIGASLTDRFRDKEVVAVCVLKGSFMFYSDLIRAIDTEVICDFFGVSSYQNSMHSSGEVKLTLDLSTSLEGKHVLLVEDIVDTGLTMNYLQHMLQTRKPASITSISLLHKPAAKKVDCQLDEVGFEIKDNFVVGYGLDYQGYYRNLPYIAEVGNIN